MKRTLTVLAHLVPTYCGRCGWWHQPPICG